MEASRLITGILAALVAASSISFAYLPPVYIANPDTGECRYYFAGDAVHFNEPPAGSWFIVGISELNATDCQDRCFFNTNKFWNEVLKVTRAGLTLTEVPLEYRIFTEMGCLCSGSGQEGCINWCENSNGNLNQTNITSSASCQCPTGSWIPGKGCQPEAGSSQPSSVSDKDSAAGMISYLVVLAAGIIAGMAIFAVRNRAVPKTAEHSVPHHVAKEVPKRKARKRK